MAETVRAPVGAAIAVTGAALDSSSTADTGQAAVEGRASEKGNTREPLTVSVRENGTVAFKKSPGSRAAHGGTTSRSVGLSHEVMPHSLFESLTIIHDGACPLSKRQATSTKVPPSDPRLPLAPSFPLLSKNVQEMRVAMQLDATTAPPSETVLL
jgi:hypothetical protein